ncbi:MAG TPA: prolipoprotein diacylglyceryl transferase [Candidatus Woesearchaeota archaeon]|nr:prolipoprotein diacylglyceryl transferase [Candidatus Woesearchaeota archaeon]
MIIYNPNPVFLSIGSVEIRYYGLMYLISFFVAYFIILKLLKIKELKLKKEEVFDFLFYILVGAIIGARIFYVVFYNPLFYIEHPLKILAFWQGGLSFHGGLFGGLIIVFLYSKKKSIRFFEITDLFSIPLAIGLFFGRLGNLLNGELYGRVSDVPWAIAFTTAPDKGLLGRHPSQIYEMIKNLIMFFVLFCFYKRSKKEGNTTALFFILYGTMRFVIEFFREPDPQLGLVFLNLTMGQLLCLAMIFIGIALLLYVNLYLNSDYFNNKKRKIQ